MNSPSGFRGVPDFSCLIPLDKGYAFALISAPRSAASFSVEKASRTSPSLMSLKLAMPMPHSMPLVTSRASSLKRLSEPILPLKTCSPSAHHLHLRIAADDAVLHAAAGDGAHLGNPEDVEHLGAAQVVLLERGFEQAHHGQAHLVLQLVDDGVQADFDALLLRQFGGLALGTHVEADDDGVRGGGQQHVALGDGADAGVDAP